MSWIAVGGAAISVVGGAIANNQQNKAAQGAANAQIKAQQLGIDEQRREYDLSRQDQMPWLQAGQGALGQLQAVNNGDYTGFYNAPDYLAAQAQGLNTLDHSAAARGGLFGGGHTRDTIQFGQGLAAQQLGAYRGSLQSIAGLGQNSAQNLGGLGANMATRIGDAYGNMGGARASSYLTRGQNNSDFTAGLTGAASNLFNQWAASRNGGGY